MTIYGFPISAQSQQNILHAMHISRLEFYLTGSRYFGGAHNNSDTDFFVADIGSAHDFLRYWGFTVESTSYGKAAYAGYDKQTVMVYKHMDANIHVQVVRDVQVKLKAQLMIKSVRSLRDKLYESKSVGIFRADKRALFWNEMYEAAEIILNTPVNATSNRV